jgi:hypothetical protein
MLAKAVHLQGNQTQAAGGDASAAAGAAKLIYYGRDFTLQMVAHGAGSSLREAAHIF